MFGKKPLLKKIAAVIFGFGALFLGINFMTGALGQIPEYESLVRIFEYLDNPFIAVLLGLVLTVIVQSSSVTVSVLVLLAGSGLVEPLACLYFILGANIGSCTPAVMAAMNANRNAKRTAFIHVMFNVVGLVVISIILAFASRLLLMELWVLAVQVTLRDLLPTQTHIQGIPDYYIIPMFRSSCKIIKEGYSFKGK